MRINARAAILSSLFMALAAAPAIAASGTAKLRGQIAVSDQPIPTLDDEDKIAATVKKWQKQTIEKGPDAESWTFHLMSFPEKRPATTQLTLLFYDVSDGKRTYLTSKDISCDADATILASEVEVSTEDGVKPGMKVELALSRIAGDRQTELARTRLTFK